jgi:type II secretory pathway predicted ATPase ExeA
VNSSLHLADYALRAHPFEDAPEAPFLWLGKPQQEALATLRAAVLRNIDLLLFTGEAGIGKTVLTTALLDDLGRVGTIIARLEAPHPEPPDFFRSIADAYRFPTGFRLREAFLAHFAAFLRDAHSKQKRVLLVIDDSQRLPRQLFREIEQLVTISKRLRDDRQNGLSLLLVGRPELNSTLRQADNVNLLRRPNIRCGLSPLTTEQVGEYVRCRLKAAGTERRVFTAGAVLQAWVASGGVPRQVNVVCGRALLEAARQGAPMVAAEIVKACVGHRRRSLERDGGGRRRELLPPRRRVTRRLGRGSASVLLSAIGLITGLGLAWTLIGGVSPGIRYDLRRHAASGDEPVSALTAVKAAAEEVRAADLGLQLSFDPGSLGEVAATRVLLRADATASIPASRAADRSALTGDGRTGIVGDSRIPRSPRSGGDALPTAGGPEGTGASLAQPPVRVSNHSQQPAQRTRASWSAGNASNEPRDALDPTAIIDWLLKDHSRNP